MQVHSCPWDRCVQMLDCGCKLLMYVNTDHCHKYIFCSWSCSNDQGILKDSPLPPGTDSVNAPPSTKLWGRGNYILKEELIGGTAIAFLSITDVHSCIYLQADIALRLLFGNRVHTEELFANSSDLCNSREWYAVFCGL